MSVETPPLIREAAETPKATGRPRRSLWQRLLASRFLFISIIVHLLFGLGAAVVVVQRYQAARKLTFKAGPPSPNPASRAVEHKVQMAKKKSMSAAPAIARRILTTGISKVTLPAMPAMPSSASAPAKMAGTGGAGSALAMGTGSAPAFAAGGSLTAMFGLREAKGGGLKGNLYDLKQTNARRPSGMTLDKYSETVDGFVRGGWKDADLSVFYRAPVSLYTNQILIPNGSATEAPKAFQVEREVKPTMWVALYQGQVTAPESGTFYFVGGGDDVLIVRFRDQTVLDGCLEVPNPPIAKTTGRYYYDWTGEQRGGLIKGEAIQVEKGKSYPIEILIGEKPGGYFYSVLLIESAGGGHTKDKKGNPILPVFRMGDGKPLPKDASLPPYLFPALVWQGTSEQKPTSGLDIFHK